MKTTVKCAVFMEYGYPEKDGLPDYSEKVWLPTVWKCQVSNNTDRIFVGEQEVTIEVPENFDPRPSQVAALEEAKCRLRAEFAAKVTEIDRQISELLAIECSEVTA